MKIELKEIPVRDLVKGYSDDKDGGVVGFGGKLDIRPPYQREFVYKDKQRDAVINSIQHDFPLNVMYWSVLPEDKFEMIDGQQRTISICQYVNGDFSFKDLYFHNLQDDRQAQILDYKLMVYQCTGTDSEKLEWFKIINIAGEKLFDQELRNAVYSGPWVTDAKRYFSRQNGAAHGLASDYLTGSAIRQDYLETAIDWISDGKIEDYMSKHSHDPNAVALWNYFQSVISWTKATFPNYRKEMKGIEWGELYNKFKDKLYDAKALEARIVELIDDDEVQSHKGIYSYVLTGDEKYLNLRQFDDKTKRRVYEKQKGLCKMCKKPFDIGEMEADHIDPWHSGGKTTDANCQMLCKEDNRRKGGK
ncbi:MAG: DUF262 domain-containing protein [Acidobacteria bacterium]|nr:DUF262 domain-containing protein [Acidobacteriota bacterium]